MNQDSIKGNLQKVGGRVEEAAGALVGDHDLKDAGREDQLKGATREAWGNVKDAGNALLDRVRGDKHEEEHKFSRDASLAHDDAAPIDKDPI